MKNEKKDILYMHLQASDRFVISYGMNFREFTYSLEQPLSHLLLLKHRFDDGEFNLNTLLDYVPKDQVENLIAEDVNEYGDFCWIDFEEETELDDLIGQEIAELLYLGHCKTHLSPPFFRKMNNQFVYLAHDDGWFNKVYYRSLDTYYQMLSQLLAMKLETLRGERTWLGIRKKKEYPAVPIEVCTSLSSLMTEGIVFSLHQIGHSRLKIEIPIWIVGDYTNMDDMVEYYHELKNESPNAWIIYHRKTQEWSVVVNK